MLVEFSLSDDLPCQSQFSFLLFVFLLSFLLGTASRCTNTQKSSNSKFKVFGQLNILMATIRVTLRQLRLTQHEEGQIK